MKLIRGFDRIRIDMWRRYNHNLTFGLGEDGRRLTGGEEHCALAKKIADEGMVLLQNNGVYVDCGVVVPRIVNRTNTGLCPMETAVINATTPTQALQMIKQKLEQLQQN